MILSNPPIPVLLGCNGHEKCWWVWSRDAAKMVAQIGWLQACCVTHQFEHWAIVWLLWRRKILQKESICTLDTLPCWSWDWSAGMVTIWQDSLPCMLHGGRFRWHIKHDISACCIRKMSRQLQGCKTLALLCYSSECESQSSLLVSWIWDSRSSMCLQECLLVRLNSIAWEVLIGFQESWRRASLQCAESWCWGLMTILAGLLPDPARNVSSFSIAFSLFNVMFFVYLSQGLACSTRSALFVSSLLGWFDGRIQALGC